MIKFEESDCVFIFFITQREFISRYGEKNSHKN